MSIFAKRFASFRPPRQLAFKNTKKIMELGNEKRYLDALHLLFGKVKHKVLSNEHYENIKKISIPLSDKLPNPFSKAIYERPEVWNAMIKSLGNEGLADESFGIFSKMKERKVEQTPETFTSLISACTRAIEISNDAEKSRSYWAKAMRVYYYMETRSIPISIVHINALLLCCSKAKEWNSLFQIYTSLNRPLSEQRKRATLSLNEFLREYRSLSKSENVEKKRRHEEELFEGLVIRSEAEFDQDSPIEEKKTDKKAEIKAITSLTQMNSLFPDVVTYNTMLTACASRGGDAAFDDAQIVWKDLKKDIEMKAAHLNQVIKEKPENEKFGRGDRKEVQLSEEEFLEWSKIEEINRRLRQEVPDISIDTGLVNAMLLVCKNAKSLKNIVKSLVLCREEFGSALDWMEFQKHIKQSNPKSFDRVRALSQSSGLIGRLDPKGNLEELEINLPSCLPNAKTLAILMSIMEKKLDIDKRIICDFYRFYSVEKPKHFQITPDDSLMLYYFKLMLSDKQYRDTIRDCKAHITKIKTMKLSPASNFSKMKAPLRVSPSPDFYQCLMEAYRETGQIDSALEIWHECQDAKSRKLIMKGTGKSFDITPGLIAEHKRLTRNQKEEKARPNQVETSKKN